MLARSDALLVITTLVASLIIAVVRLYDVGFLR